MSINQNKKVSLYKSIKIDFYTEPYISIVKNKINRSLLSRLRAGCFDLEIETGRWRSIEKENRTLCDNGVEDEAYFVFHCRKLEHIRKLSSNILELGEGIHMRE